jgi:hypothetical protein
MRLLSMSSTHACSLSLVWVGVPRRLSRESLPICSPFWPQIAIWVRLPEPSSPPLLTFPSRCSEGLSQHVLTFDCHLWVRVPKGLPLARSLQAPRSERPASLPWLETRNPGMQTQRSSTAAIMLGGRQRLAKQQGCVASLSACHARRWRPCPSSWWVGLTYREHGRWCFNWHLCLDCQTPPAAVALHTGRRHLPEGVQMPRYLPERETEGRATSPDHAFLLKPYWAAVEL